MNTQLAEAPARSSGLIGALRAFFDTLASASQAARCGREAERLFALSDAELARLGLTRDRVVQHAFRQYLGR